VCSRVQPCSRTICQRALVVPIGANPESSRSLVRIAPLQINDRTERPSRPGDSVSGGTKRPSHREEARVFWEAIIKAPI
jgi:hypothetical protein